MIRRFSIGYDLELLKRTVEQGLVSLIGPDADAVAGRLGWSAAGLALLAADAAALDPELTRAHRRPRTGWPPVPTGGPRRTPCAGRRRRARRRRPRSP